MSAPLTDDPGSSDVKGIWFASARAYLADEHGTAMLQRLLDDMPPGFRSALEDPLASEWYPEEALAQMLQSLHRVVAEGDDDRFATLIEQSTISGVGRFFRILLSLSTPGFVLRKVPILWGRMRRGAGRVTVEPRPGAAVIHYSEFPRFHDPLYRILTVASLRGVARVCGSRHPEVRILSATRDTLDVEVRY